MRFFVVFCCYIILLSLIIAGCYSYEHPHLDGDLDLNIAHPDSIVTKITGFMVLNDSAITRNPSFPNGLDSLAKMLKHPDLARKAGLYGAIIINFNIDIDGRAKNIKPVSGITWLSNFVIKELENLKFNPAFLDKKPVTSSVQLSILYYRIDEDKNYVKEFG